MKYETVIGVLTYSKMDFLRRCVESFFRNTTDILDPQKTVFIIANNSEDPDYIRKVEILANPYGNITTLNFRRNRGTSAAWNTITRAYDCQNVVIANDDIMVHPGWKEAMELSFAVQPNIGVFSFQAKHGKVEWDFHNNTPVPQSLSFQQVIYPPGSFLMFKKDKFDQVGGFDEQLWMGIEEVDFAIRLMRAGYLNYQVGDSKWRYFYIGHYGGGTEYFAKDAAPELHEQATKNVEYFQQKHQTQWPLTQEFERKMRGL